MSIASRIYETLTGMVKLVVGESLRRVHRANQPQTIARAQRPRTSAKARLAARLAKQMPKGKHWDGRRKAGPPPQQQPLSHHADRPHGRTYPAAPAAYGWVSTGKRARAAQHKAARSTQITPGPNTPKRDSLGRLKEPQRQALEEGRGK